MLVDTFDPEEGQIRTVNPASILMSFGLFLVDK